MGGVLEDSVAQGLDQEGLSRTQFDHVIPRFGHVRESPLDRPCHEEAGILQWKFTYRDSVAEAEKC